MSKPDNAAVETAAVGLLALGTRIPGLGHEPWGDELYHILSAREYLETGVFGINGGVYERSWAYSEMVAGLYRLFGVSPVVARLPALIAAVLTIVLLFVWIRRTGDRLAAWVAALLLVFTPDLIEQAQYARFYPLQHLFLLLAVVATGAFLALPRWTGVRAAVLAAAAAVSLAIALYFQMLTVIGAAGLAVGVALLAGPRLMAVVPPQRRALAAGAAAAALLLAAAVVLQAEAAGQRMLALATYTDLWAEGSRNEIRFYHWLLLDDYPTAWTLFPVLGILALARRPRLTTLALAVFTVGFLAHTLLAWKSPRYLSYTLPFFAAVVGLGVSEAVAPVRDRLERAIGGAARHGRLLRRAAAAATVVFVLITNSAFTQSVRLMVRDQSFLYPGGPTPTLSWTLAGETLAPIARSVDAVVSTEDLEAFWYLGRLDYVLDRDHLLQGRAKPEFSVDGRIMTRMIGGTEPLRRVIACHPSGLLVAMRWAMSSYKMAPETAAFIRTTLEPVPLPYETGLVAFRWDHAPDPVAGACPGIPPEGEPL